MTEDGHDHHPIAQKLLQSFRQFRRGMWSHRSFAGYKYSEIMVLFCLKRRVQPGEPGLKVSEISKWLHVTSPTITQLINGLEANGLVERHIDPEDRRAVRIKLTAAGDELTQRASAAFYASFDGLIAYLGEEQSNQLAELLVKVSDYFQNEQAEGNGPLGNGDENS